MRDDRGKADHVRRGQRRQHPRPEDRYRELAQRDALAKAIAIKKARGDYQPGGHVSEENFPPLTVAEHLEMIALGERIARYYTHPSQVDVAVKAGASWAQIAAARGTDEQAARQQYREWAEGQHKYAGMGDEEYAAAIARARAGEERHATAWTTPRPGSKSWPG